MGPLTCCCSEASGVSVRVRPFREAAALCCTKGRGKTRLGHMMYLLLKKKIPETLLIFSFLNKVSTLKPKLVF